jgi:hypothetical protein
MQWLRLVVVVLAACGPGLAKKSSDLPKRPPWAEPVGESRPGAPPAADEAGFRAMLQGEVTSGGLFFPDEACQAQFGKAGPVPPDAFDAFARCVATLHLRPTGRTHWIDDGSIVTDDAGFEIEAHVVGGKLDYIGFAGRAPGMPDLPTITPETFESLRASGDRNASLTDDEAKKLMRSWDNSLTQHLRLCLSPAGTITRVVPGGNQPWPAIFAAFRAVTRAWTFKPFVVAGRPIAACAIIQLAYPATTPKPNRLPAPPERSKAGNTVYFIPPTDLEGYRLTGDRLIVPDDEDKVRVSMSREHRLIGSFKLCIDETGHYERGILLKSTGLPGYDAKIARELMRWSYKPFLVDGASVPFCTAVTFIYSQR